jgi:CTP:molybdopterin cytidylyltransferase MocA
MTRAVILAAGRGRRVGQLECLVNLDGGPLHPRSPGYDRIAATTAKQKGISHRHFWEPMGNGAKEGKLLLEDGPDEIAKCCVG